MYPLVNKNIHLTNTLAGDKNKLIPPENVLAVGKVKKRDQISQQVDTCFTVRNKQKSNTVMIRDR